MVESALQILSHDSKIVDCVRIEVTVYRARLCCFYERLQLNGAQGKMRLLNSFCRICFVLRLQVVLVDISCSLKISVIK